MSALRKIVDVIIDENELTEITLWSDSYMPQNQNSIISNAFLDLLKDNSQIEKITMKYSLSGHSCVQEVDNVHSLIEKAMRSTDFCLPICLIRILKSISPNNPYKVIQMKETDLKDLHLLQNYSTIKTYPPPKYHF